MSIVNEENVKVLLPRSGPDDFWQIVAEEFAGRDERKWRYLAMLVLREHAGWPLEYIAKVFRHKPGHITRCLTRIKDELRTVLPNPYTDEDEVDEEQAR